MERDYGEILCTAIDEIVSSRIQGIECDITKLCTIKDDSYAYEGKYVVSDGGAKFEAFSDDTSFRNGNSVLVTIPNGDFNLQKIIIGRVAATDTTPFKYTSPLSTMLKVEDDLMININESETGLLINKNNQSSAIKHLEIELSQRDINKYKGFTRLGISADFKCLLNNYDVTSGSYGIKLLIQADVMTKPGEINTDGIVELTLNTDDMYGNPYYFDNYFIQEKVFDISSIMNIKGISVYLYQDGQFKDSSNNYIPWAYTELDGTITPLRNNLFINNLQLYFGYELNRYKGETLEVFSYTSPLSFHQDREENKKEIGLRWIHQNKDSSITILEENDLTDRHEIHWFRYNYGYEKVNEYAGANWEEITPKENENYLYHSFEHSFNPDIKKQNEQIKVVGIIKEKINTEIFNNIFEDITSKYIFYELNNNRRQYKLKVIGQIIDDTYTWQYKLVYVNEIYDLLFENAKFYIIKNNNKIEVQILSNVDRIFFEKYNIRIKGSKNRYYIFFDRNDCSIKILNSNDFSIYWRQIEDEETKEKLNFYYYLDAENNEIELELVSDRIFEDMYKELTTIKIENYETLEEYYNAIDNIYIKYNGTEPAIEYLINKYTSNILKFENEIQVVDDLTYRAATALAIICEDGSEGNYFIYDQNGKIINEGQGNGDIKYFNILYQGQPLDPKKLSGNSYIKWYLPFDNDNNKANVNSKLHNTHTMVVKNEALWSYEKGEYKDKNNQQYFDVDFNDGVDYIGVKRTVKIDNNNIRSLQTKQPYMIKNFLTSQDSNNIVRCELFIDNVLHKTQEELHFGKAGSNGTNTTLVLEMINGKNALNVDGEDKSLQVRAILYNKNGKIIDFPETTFDEGEESEFKGKNIIWSWHSFSIDEEGEDKEYIKINGSNRATDLIQLDCLVNDVPQDNYYILKATVGGTPNLEAYLPIPIRTSNIPKIEGAKEVLYDYQGVPSYYSDAYVLYNENNQEIEEARESWDISTVGTDIRYLPQLKNITRGDKIDFKALVAAPFYSQGDNSKVCVYCNYENYKWSQPILVAQNHYNFDVLNQWNGGLTLDENNGTILSTMLGAGRKNERNEYSGVLIGDIQGGTNLNSSDTHTGVYGLHNGELSYALKDDGTATFGKAGHGQIKIDGNSGEIYSPNFKSNNSSGMLIDLDNGEINIHDNGYKKVCISPNGNENGKSYLSIYGQNNRSLIEISNNQYFLRSYNKAINPNGYGTLFDLDGGSLTIDGPGGEIYFSSKENADLFRITNKDGYPLLQMNDKKYYLQSSSYLGRAPLSLIKDDEEYYLYSNFFSSIKNGSTNEFELSQIIAVCKDNLYLVKDTENKLYGDFTKEEIDISNLNLDNLKIGDKIEFEETEIEVNMGNNGENNSSITETIKYTKKEYKEWFITTLNLLEKDVEPSGLNIDLINGKIDGYNLYLRGKGSNGEFLLDSGAPLTPFQIGKKFKVNWNGTLYCETVQYLGNKPPKSTYVINMNDNFYVTKGGGVGANSITAGTGTFSGGWFGGTANKAKEAESVPASGIKGIEASNMGLIALIYGGLKYTTEFGIGSLRQMDKDISELKSKVAALESKV